MVLGKLDATCKKKNLDLRTLYTNVNSKWIIHKHKSYNYKTFKGKQKKSFNTWGQAKNSQTFNKSTIYKRRKMINWNSLKFKTLSPKTLLTT